MWAVVLSLLPLLAVEVVLRLVNVGQLSELDDPYVGFAAVRPLFVKDAAGERYEIDKARQMYFRPDSFAVTKGEREFRIFCLGGSTVQGRPYAIETSFTTWLELSLQAADPRRDWQVVNCGGVSYASYRLAPILEELLAREPDLFVIYTGHNEFLEDRTYRGVKQLPAAFSYLHGAAANLRTYNLLRSFWLRASGQVRSRSTPQNELPLEVDALLDYRGGLADYHQDDQWRRGAVVHYRLNLLRMIGMARSAGVPVVLVNPVSNLRDCPPFKIEINQQLTPKQRALFEQRWEAARLYEGADIVKQIELVRQALEVDERHAGAYFLLGKCLERAGQLEEARQAYVRAKDEDICPLRMIEPLHTALRRVAQETETPLVEARDLIRGVSRRGIVGNGWLLDHIHPSINGHQLIADALLEEMAQMGLVQPRQDWQEHQEELFAAHLKGLDDIYFAHGRQRLEGLIRWTQGRANKLKSGGLAPPE